MTLPEALSTLPGNWVQTARERLRRYEIPERGEQGHTDYVLLPDSEAAVGELLALATRERFPLVISAGRTGLVEAQRPQGEGVLSLEKLQRLLSLQLADGRRFEFPEQGDAASVVYAWWRQQEAPSLAGALLEVQPGVAVDAVNALLEPLGLVWPVEVGSGSAASVGACVANASAGANAVCYGTAAHLCESAAGYWANGSAAGPFAGPVWSTPTTDELAIDSTRIVVDWGLIGSQGLFGVITNLRLRLWPQPPAREGVLIPLPDMPSAMRLLQGAQRAFPGDVEVFEFIGRRALELVLWHLGEAVQLPLAPERLQSWCVLLQVKGGDDLAERLYGFLAEQAGIADEDIGYAPLPALKRIRHAITEASNAHMRAQKGGRLSFDTAVPPGRFGEYLDALSTRLVRDHAGVELIAFGHAGVGGAHLHLIGSRAKPVDMHAAALVKLVFDVTQYFGGTFAAEHGVGPKWSEEFRRRMPAATLQRLRQEKRHRDPAGILNPRSFGLLD